VIKTAVRIPVIANGDIDSPEKARFVLEQTGADALMIGRAALGKPWLFAQINAGLDKQTALPKPDAKELQDLLNEHLTELHRFYGEYAGVRVARKHIGWYAKSLELADPAPLKSIFAAEDARQQIRLTQALFC
jgi:tRNA-dihydrouridine synthase B